MDDVSISTTGMPDPPPLSVLIVDDDKTNRLILSTLIKKLGYNVISAVNGEEAVRMYGNNRPDIILMDVMMPVMNGYDAAVEIKRICGEVFVPIIFLTAITDENALAKCIEYGGDDFITKPYNSTIINAKINAMVRVRGLYNRIADSKSELQEHHSRLQLEHEIAETIFTNITNPKNLEIANIQYLLKPMSITSGDILLCSRTPSGGMHVMLGDFTGHGLSAAIGAIPVSDTFYSLSSKGYSIGDIAFNINKRLKETLPSGFFCATCLIEADEAFRTVAVWNGGNPDIIITTNDAPPIKIPSSHLPLGVLNSDEFDRSVEFIELGANDKIYMVSDGVVEAQNSQGNMYTQERLDAVLLESQNNRNPFSAIEDSINQFCRNTEQFDDITLIEIAAKPLDTIDNTHTEKNDQVLVSVNWALSMKLGAGALQQTNPCPLITQSIMEIQGLSEHRERIYTILSELYSNSLEHGILRLDSSIKENPQGFTEYYNARELALSNLKNSSIEISIEHHPLPSNHGGNIIIIIEDTGTGFDISSSNSSLEDNKNSHGRGINLVKSLCTSLLYTKKGTRVEAHYQW
ncbi:MAG: SpoIIE family protein phosphatase [Thiotrichaceae bacterium]|nr:SpoIIE family protein phosphatase [Thiotrichaceae bacterium]PCI15104.1 MAG: fused response regulator/phosphatase [Thiotrichales bacterium]